MSQPEASNQESVHTPDEVSDAVRLPVDVVERVVVKEHTKTVEVWFKRPNLAIQSDDGNAGSPRDGEALPVNLNTASQFLQDFLVIKSACVDAFKDLAANIRMVPPVWSEPVPADLVRAMVHAAIESYSSDEPIAGRWLLNADWSVAPLDSPHKDEQPFGVTVTFQLGNDSEKVSLERKDAKTWMADCCSSVFGLRISCEFEVSAAATEKAAVLREQLEAAQREEVQGIVAREEAAAASAEKKPSGKPPEERFYKRDRNSNDGPALPLTLGRKIEAELTSIHDIVDEMRHVAVMGRVFAVDKRTLPSGRTLVQFNITDDTDSITAKLFTNQDKQLESLEPLSDGVWLKIQGQVQFDTYAKEIVFLVQDMEPADHSGRQDTATEKRVELHLHTPMSSLDGVTPFAEYAKQAALWGHEAIAVTDHGVVQDFPEAYLVGQKYGIKVLLGVEAYVVDDGTPIVYHAEDLPLDDTTTYVVFDTETTGLNAREDTLIEIAAVRMKGRAIVDSFSTLIDPERKLSAKISDLTGISQDMLVGQPKLKTALSDFQAFAKGAVLVAHNAEFDAGFLAQCAKRIESPPWTNPIVDTLALARSLYPGERNYKLKTLTQKFSVELVNHHRALADAEATGKIFAHMQDDFAKQGITNLKDLNQLAAHVDTTRMRPFHATILVQNATGLRNLYELVSLAHTKYLHRIPRIPRSELVRFRPGLLIGTACQRGELIQAFLRGKNEDEIEDICKFYDYLEIQPLHHYENLVREEIIENLHSIEQMHRQIVAMGKKLNIPVVATGDVHYLEPKDRVYRDIFLQSQNGGNGAGASSLHFATTDEMLRAFEYLGEDAEDVVVHSPNAVAAQIENVKPIPDDLYTPVIEGAAEEIQSLAYGKAKRMYGDPLPPVVQARLERELHSIIDHGFSVIYLIAQKLVTKSLSDGYLVGSRGSVGSSLVATMTDITEVNPLAPHYLCPNCQYSEFVEDGLVGSGFDLPPKACPKCGTQLKKDGQNIPFETFLGFHGDKVPDIDLNFSGEYQPRAHHYTEELFGKDYVFRAGTISTVAEKTAYGYVKKFAEEKGLMLRNAEIDRLVKGCTGIKRTTGQHPGGQMVVPNNLSIFDFTPVQYPADDKSSGTLTTHFDYHSISGRLLKLDILGHDDPTVIRMLQDLTGIDPKTIPLDDPLVLGLFTGTETLGVSPEAIRSVTGTYAIPEFGTKFVRQMLEDTKPKGFSELVRISGLSHGTDVWLNNAQTLIKEGTAGLSDVICARDDIMVYLIYKGLEPSRAFKIMESIRKGKGVKEEDAEYMRSFDVPEWYIESGRKIKYMFPKAHACAYVIMAMRIAWYKVHCPLKFYATYFSVRADDFDIALMAKGQTAIVQKIEEIEQKGNAAATKEKSLLTVLEVALEMVVRGFHFLPVDLYRSHATKFQAIDDEKALLPPFAAVTGVGETAAKNLHQACQQGPFLSIEDLQSRSHISKTVIEILEGLGCLAGLPDSNQLSLF